jgi:O-methyltransferase involved in polyketide biosynthesis
MREGRPSVTAGNVALARAWLTRAGIVDDPYAQTFLSRRQAEVERLLWWSRRTRLGQRSFAYLAARTRFYDAVVTDALDAGIDQVRPRRRRLRHPDMAAGPAEVLAEAGLQPSRPSVICCEGITMYLTAVAVKRLLTSLAAIAAHGSRVGVEFGAEVVTERDPHRLLRGLTRLWHARAGEPIVTELDPSDAPDLLAECGWTIEEILPAPALQDRYLDPAELRFRFTHAGNFTVAASRSAAATTSLPGRV